MEHKEQPKLVLDPNAENTFEDHPGELAQWEKDILNPVSAEMHDHRYAMLDSTLAPFEHEAGKLMEAIAALDSASQEPAYEALPAKPDTKKQAFKKYIKRMFSSKKVIEPIDDNRLSNKPERIDTDIKHWLKKHAEYDTKIQTYTGIEFDENDEFAKARSEDIIMAMLGKIGSFNFRATQDIVELLSTSVGLSPMSESFGQELVRWGAYGVVARRPDLFPGLAYDEELAGAIIKSASLTLLCAECDVSKVFAGVNWQSVVEKMIDNGKEDDVASALCDNSGGLLPVELSLDHVQRLMGKCPWMMLEYLKYYGGAISLLNRYSSLELVDMFEWMGYSSDGYQAGLGRNLTEDEIFKIASRGEDEANTLMEQWSNIELFKSEEFVDKYLDLYEYLRVSCMQYGSFSEQLQSKAFERLKPELEGTTYLVSLLSEKCGFTKLSEDCQYYIIEHCREAIQSLTSIEAVKDFFIGFGATPEILERIEVEFSEYFEGMLERRNAVADANIARHDRRQAEESYFTAAGVKLELAGPDVALTPETIAEYLDYDHVVRAAPTLTEQLADDGRNNDITCNGMNGGDPTIMTERKMLTLFNEQLNSAIQLLDSSGIKTEQLKSLRDNLTFIGEKEYQEAVQAIAAYWKHCLDTNPDQKILVYAGIGQINRVKSDHYMLDKILEHFSDDEIRQYKGRLVRNEEDVENVEPEQLKVVLVDDWTISGAQLKAAVGSFVYRNPELEQCVEVQLIAASKERIALGLENVQYTYQGIETQNLPVPVKAYYLAHDAEAQRTASSRGVHITGSHSSVDFGFEWLISEFQTTIRHYDYSAASVLDNVPLTGIARVYREPGFVLTNIDRFNRLTAEKIAA